MKTASQRRPIPFPFIIDELESLRPTIRNVFGFTHVYLEDKLLFSLRDAPTRPGSNGMWIYTTIEHADTLAREFSDLPRRQIWRSGKKAWIVLASRLENFEEHAFKACELILRGDQRIGRLSRRMSQMIEPRMPAERRGSEPDKRFLR
jgi:hypothetical protein